MFYFNKYNNKYQYKREPTTMKPYPKTPNHVAHPIIVALGTLIGYLIGIIIAIGLFVLFLKGFPIFLEFLTHIWWGVSGNS